MNQLELLLPFGLPPAEMARDLLRELKTPALATLLSHANRHGHQLSDGFARALPHEIWLARQCGLNATGDSSPPLATSAMRACGLTAEAGTWFVLQPAHLHIARDHLVLTDMRQLKLSDADARTLFELIRPLCAESGRTLLYGDAQTWFLRADDWQSLQTSTPDAACGHNIDIWMPKGAGERDWRQLQNEIQMHWHAHAVNDEREARGLKPVNSVWLWGAASTTLSTSLPAAPCKITQAFQLPGARNPFAALTPEQLPAAAAADVVARKPEHGLLLLDSLIEPALSGDWSTWLERLHRLETEWFAPLLAAIRNNQLAQLSLTLSHNTALSGFSIGKSSLRKFWIKPSLARLAA